MLRIFTLEYDPLKKGFDDAALTSFLAGKSIINIEKRFFKQNSKYYWTFAIEYEGKGEASSDIELATDEQKELFLALKEWRNDLAAEKGVPPYLLFTNNQLKKIALEKPKTMDELKNIHMVSSKKAQEYGEAIFKIIAQNVKDGQEPRLPDLRPLD